MRTLLVKLTILLSVAALSLPAQQAQQDKAMLAKAQRLAQQYIIVDTHIDVPYRLKMKFEDISKLTPDGNFDYVRAKQGGLKAPFMSIYIPAEYAYGKEGKPPTIGPDQPLIFEVELLSLKGEPVDLYAPGSIEAIPAGPELPATPDKK